MIIIRNNYYYIITIKDKNILLGQFSGRLSGRQNYIVGGYAGEWWDRFIRAAGTTCQRRLGHWGIDHVTVSFRETRFDRWYGRACCSGGRYAWM